MIGSEAHLDDVQTRRDTRGERYDGQIERLCLFFKGKGMPVSCEAEPDPANPERPR